MKRRVRIHAARNAHPLVHQLYAEMHTQACDSFLMAERSGVSRATIMNWASKSQPRLHDLEACFNVLGLTLQPKELKMSRMYDAEHRIRTPIGQDDPLLRQLAEEMDKRWTQVSLGDASGNSQQTIKSLREGSHDVGFKKVQRIANAMGFEFRLVRKLIG